MIASAVEIDLVARGKRRAMLLPVERGSAGERRRCPVELGQCVRLQHRVGAKSTPITIAEARLLTTLGMMTAADARALGCRYGVVEAKAAWQRSYVAVALRPREPPSWWADPWAEALAVPLRRLGQIALWSLLASLVGVVIEQVASWLPLVGSIAVRLFGVTWSLASMFAVPILAVEGCSAPACLRRSAKLVKQRWGEGIAGNLIITAWMGIAFVGVLFVLIAGLVAARGSTGARLAVAGVAVIAFVLLMAAAAVIRQAFAVVLYRYATDGSAPGPFSDGDLQTPFSRRRHRSS